MKNKSRLYRGSVAVTLIIACLFLTACGGEFVGRNDESTGAVSKGAVSGAAVEEEKKTNENQKWNEIQQMVTDVCPYHNSRCVYIEGDDNKLEQRTLEGKKLQAFSVPGLEKENDDWDIEAVTDQEILYSVKGSDDDPKNFSELWSVPLEETSGKESLVPERAEKILEGKNVNVIYADSDYIAIQSDASGYFDYDREKKKKTAVDMADSGQVYDTADEYVVKQGMGTSDTILLSKRLERYELCDLYVHKVGSGKVKKIHDVQNEDEDELYELTNDYVYFDNWIFYCLGKEVWCYDVKQEEKQRLLTEDMLSSLWQEDPEGYIENIYVDSKKLYIEAHTLDGRKVFSCPWRPGEKRECKWEKGLDMCLGECGKLNVEVETIQSGRCFYTLDPDTDNEIRYCYDLERETDQRVREDDPENCAWWFWENG